jgi:hypothetical protein
LITAGLWPSRILVKPLYVRRSGVRLQLHLRYPQVATVSFEGNASYAPQRLIDGYPTFEIAETLDINNRGRILTFGYINSQNTLLLLTPSTESYYPDLAANAGAHRPSPCQGEQVPEAGSCIAIFPEFPGANQASTRNTTKGRLFSAENPSIYFGRESRLSVYQSDISPHITDVNRGLRLAILICLAVPSLAWPATRETKVARTSASTADYFPLATGEKWILRQVGGSGQCSLEVIATVSGVSHVRFISPWSSADWVLKRAGQRYFLTAYGTSGAMPALAPVALLFDFGVSAAPAWSNALGTFSVDKKKTSAINTGRVAYQNTISIRQALFSGQNTFTFASDIGIVAIVTGGVTFALDEAHSSLPLVGAAAATGQPLPPLGLIPNGLANKAYSAPDVVNEIASIASDGFQFLVGYGRWTDLEPQANQLALDSLRFQISEADQLNLSASYTFCIVDMGLRNLPPELMNLRWNDPLMLARVDRIIEALANEFKGRVAWFQFGNEVDTYFNLHPGEIADYALLLQEVRRKMASVSAQVKVSVTVKSEATKALNGRLAPLNNLSDLLVVTYGAYNDDFTVQSPASADSEIAALLAAAGNRSLLFQEISFPAAAANNSSPQTQAAFHQRVLDNLREAGGKIAAANFFCYADYTVQTAQAIAASAGLGDRPLFVSFMESLGMFDVNGNPKPSWTVFTGAFSQAQ